MVPETLALFAAQRHFYLPATALCHAERVARGGGATALLLYDVMGGRVHGVWGADAPVLQPLGVVRYGPNSAPTRGPTSPSREGGEERILGDKMGSRCTRALY